jgi:hypothetical protein
MYIAYCQIVILYLNRLLSDGSGCTWWHFSKDFYIIRLSNILAMSVPNERYSWNASCALMLIFTFLLFQKRVLRTNADIYVFIIPETRRVH